MIIESNLILGYHLTEKSNHLAEQGKYVFLVSPDANKKSVYIAIKKYFKVEIEKVNLINRKRKWMPNKKNKGKGGFTRNKKYAIVTLKTGDQIKLIQ